MGEILVSLFVVLGAAFTLIGSIGLVKLPDVFTRLHGPTKATTLGVGGVLIASIIYFSDQGARFTIHEFLILVFLFITAPVSAHLIAKAALHRKLPSECEVPERFSSGESD